MQIRNKLLSFFVGLSFFGLALVGLITFNSSINSHTQYERLVLQDISEHIVEMLGNEHSSLTDADTLMPLLAGLATKNLRIYLVDGAGRLMPTSTRRAEKNDSLTLDVVREIIQSDETGGHTHLHDQGYSWLETPIPSTTHTLVLVRKGKSTSRFAEYFDSFGIPLITTWLVLLWISVWGALITASLFKKVEQQKIALHEQAAELEKAKDSALSSSKAKSMFLANMSHEIRTPLSAIIGFSELLQQGNQSPDESAASINTITRSGKHLLHVINEILDVSKIEARRIDIENIEVSIFSVFKDIEDIMRAQAEDKQLFFRVDYQFPLPVTIISDPVRLRQILINICSNAVKFTNEGEVCLRATYDTDRECIVFEVSDMGIGIPEEKIQQLFHPFSQADTSTTREYGGTGLGLFLSRQLAEMMGGTLELDSKEGVGSTFTITIPAGSLKNIKMLQSISDIPETLHVETTPTIIRLDAVNILLAEDNADNQRLFSLYLSGVGAKVTVVEDGEQALNKVRVQDFDIVLMDMQMPLMGGVEAVSRIRNEGFTLPIIALTANATNQAREECLGAGYNDFVTKPVELDQLFNVISKYVKLQEPEKDHGRTKSILDTEQGKRVVKMFLNGLPDMRKAIEAALASRDIETLNDLFHQLRGLGGAVGFPVITQLAKEIETPLASEDYDAIKNKVNEFNKICDRICSHD